MASDALMVREFTVGAGQRAPEAPGETQWCPGVRVPPRRIVPAVLASPPLYMPAHARLAGL
jgi:hypothetical protein